MLQVEEIEKFSQTLHRIFSLKVSRSTFREVQNGAVSSSGGNKETAKTLFEYLMKGVPAQGDLSNETYEVLQTLVKEYSIPVRLAKDVNEKGEFINLITSDTLRQGELFAFLNRIRRVDGDEFQFITDLDATLHLLLHFGSRLQELKGAEGGSELLTNKKEALTVIRNQIDALIIEE